MITVRQHEKLIDRIKGLSEIELDDLLNDINEHLRKNNLDHIADAAFRIPNNIEMIQRLEDELDEMTETKDRYVDNMADIEILCGNALDVEEFEEGAFDEIRTIVMKIQDKANEIH